MENSKKSKNSEIDPFDLDLTSDTNGFGLTAPTQKEKAPSPQKEPKTKEKAINQKSFPEKVSKKEIRYASDTQKAVPIDEAIHRKASLLARGLNTSIKSVIQEGINILYQTHLKEIQDYHKAEQARLKDLMGE
jgi:hypothetical protein